MATPFPGLRREQSGVALVRDAAGYRLIPQGEAVGAANIDRAAIPRRAGLWCLRHPAAIRGAERRSAIDTVMSFDVDWMRGQSVGIYPIQNGSPESIIVELEKIMDSGEAG